MPLAGLMRGGLARSGGGIASASWAAAGWAGSASAGIAGRVRDVRLAAVPVMPVVVKGSRTLGVPLRVMLVADVSGSTSTTDPDRVSFKAVRSAVAWLADNGGDERDRVGLVRFAVSADSVAPVRVRHAARVIEHGLAKSTSQLGGGTCLSPAVDELCSNLARRQGRTVVVLISDGQVSEPDAVLRGLVGRIRSVADAVYLLALDHDRVWSHSTHLRYQGLGIDAIQPIGTLGEAHIAATIANVLVHEGGLLTTGGGGV